MNINFGLFPPLDVAVRAADGTRLKGPAKTVAKKRALTARALRDLDGWSRTGPPEAGHSRADADRLTPVS
jgi:methylenetetrahydrofolate--tRNA-(uracil-5-)-methyltransferase